MISSRCGGNPERCLETSHFIHLFSCVNTYYQSRSNTLSLYFLPLIQVAIFIICFSTLVVEASSCPKTVVRMSGIDLPLELRTSPDGLQREPKLDTRMLDS